MMNKLFLTGIFQAMLCLSAQAYAASEDNTVTINYSGLVVASPCEIVTEKVDIIFEDNIGADVLANTGDKTDWKAGYNINLSGCEPGTKITMKMEGQAATDNKYYKNQADAKNIVIELASDDDQSTDYSNASERNFQLPVGVDNIAIPLKARLLNSGDGVAEPGLVKAVITATFSYN